MTETTALVMVDPNGEAATFREELSRELEAGDFRSGGWFTKLVGQYMRYWYSHAERRAKTDAHVGDGTETERAKRIIRRACMKSAVTGAAAGSVSTGATVLTAQTEGFGGIVALPIAAAGIGCDMLYRALLHIGLTCDLARIFNVRLDPDDPTDVWMLFALAFKTTDHDEGDEGQGKDLLKRVMHLHADEVGEAIGSKLIGESLLRNVVPFVGVATSSIANWRMTKRIGDTARRYMRYRRAFRDAFSKAEIDCTGHYDVLLEGVWFVFTADGRLEPEEAAVLAGLLRRCEPVMRARMTERFVEDEVGWLERLRDIPESGRDTFLHALEVVAAVDKSVSLPERRVLRNAARALGREFNPARIEELIRTFDEVGVLAPQRTIH